MRAAERAVEWPDATDAGLIFIGRIRTPWTSRMVCARQGRPDGPLCRIEVLYWLHRSRRDLDHQSPRNDGTNRGTYSLRSPARPSPIGASIASLIKVEGSMLPVRGLDCLDDTSLLDLKLFTPLVPPTPGDSDVGDP